MSMSTTVHLTHENKLAKCEVYEHYRQDGKLSHVALRIISGDGDEISLVFSDLHAAGRMLDMLGSHYQDAMQQRDERISVARGNAGLLSVAPERTTTDDMPQLREIREY